MFYVPGLVFDGTESVGSRFHVLCVRSHLRRYRGRLISFSAVPRASGPVFLFSAAGHVFNGTEGVGSRFQVLRARTHFRRYRERRVPFSCFLLPDLFSAVPRALGPVFMFSATELVFGDIEGVGYLFMFCAPGLVFGGTQSEGSLFHVLRYRTLFRRYHGRQVSFSGFARPNSFLALRRASGPVFMFCAPGLIFHYTEGSRVPFSCFTLSDSFLEVPTASHPVFMFSAPGHVFGGTEGFGSRFPVLGSRGRFRRYRGHRVLFSSFARPD
jgi:hypothetical protein